MLPGPVSFFCYISFIIKKKMKKTLFTLLTLLLLSVPVMAQTISKGYYRVRNFYTSSYILLTDSSTKGIDYHVGGYDVDALRTRYDYDRVCCDPSSVYYIENAGGTNYNLRSQGKGVYEFVGRYLTVRHVTGTSQSIYTASGIYEGIEVFLSSSYDPDDPQSDGYLNAGSASDHVVVKDEYGHDISNEVKWWRVVPVSATDDTNFFGIKPEVTVGGQRYAPFFASFPFTPVAPGMKVYTVNLVDGNLAVISEVQGKVAGGTPVIIACPGATPSDNRVNIEMQDTSRPAGNKLRGIYFNSSDFYGPNAFHYNAKPWDVATMRILGVTSTGKLGFIKSTTQKTIPRNKAYLVVSADAPDEITLMTQAEYDEEKAKVPVTITARSYSREYGEENPAFAYDADPADILQGSPSLSCSATATSPFGNYDIVVSRGTVSNSQVNFVNGTLTVTKAPVTVTAKSYTIKQNEPLPAFEADYSGFKLGETADVLTAKPSFTCNVPADKAPGTYDIIVAGAEAANYSFSYVAGTLTVTEADPITLTAADATMVYGDALPEFTFTVSGGTVEGTPAFTCEATPQSPVGTYVIKIKPGSVSYPNLKLVNATLTITKAPLTASVGNYKRSPGEPNPDFVITYNGFRNNDDASVFIAAPTATCEATADSPVGNYPIVVSGGEAQNYEFNYVNGVLEVVETQGIAAVCVTFHQPVDIFTADGRCVRRAATSMAGLPRGLYIVEGRKVIIR